MFLRRYKRFALALALVEALLALARDELATRRRRPRPAPRRRAGVTPSEGRT
ncbi:MAG TPA: hypothetical protein VMW35_17510 [Myxococcota bacterium]|jgi:hypothetical protein|nr:hypothetical protein [Myxococcota bacterium]